MDIVAEVERRSITVKPSTDRETDSDFLIIEALQIRAEAKGHRLRLYRPILTGSAFRAASDSALCFDHARRNPAVRSFYPQLPPGWPDASDPSPSAPVRRDGP